MEPATTPDEVQVNPIVETTAKCNDPICVPLPDGTCLGVRLPPACEEETRCETTSLSLARSLVAEYLGTLVLVWVVVGSGIMGETLSDDVGVQLIINSLATVGGLYNLILILGHVSGCHINPIVSMIDVISGEIELRKFACFVGVQIAGGISGALIANLTFEHSFAMSEKNRFGYHLWVSEILSTALLILVIHGNLRTGQAEAIPGAVSLLVGAGYFFTSSTIFANPAVTIGRMFSNSFAGIQPRSAGPFVVCQIMGACIGYALARFLFPTPKKNNKGCQQLRQVAFVDMSSENANKCA